MKTVRKILVALLMLVYTVGTVGTALAAESVSVDSLEVKYEKTINVSLNNEIDVNALGDDDVKILHDIPVISSDLDPADARKKLISLYQELAENAIYNLISIDGAEGNLDFETSTNLAGEEIYSEAERGIESVNIIDPKNIEVTYFEPVIESEVSLKLFRDISIESLSSISNTEIGVETTEKLITSNNYIFMLISAQSLDNSEVDIENGIYNFETPSYLEQAPEVSQSEQPDLNAASEEETKEEVVEETEANQEQTVETQETAVVEENEQAVTELDETTAESAQTAETTTEEITKSGESNIEQVAAEATAVPETGTATSIMIFLTMLFAFGIHMKKRK